MSWMQWFGVTKWAEGPTADYLATSLKQAPGRVPERPSGESSDILGKLTLCLTLQTRGQHIRTDKSTSNVGTAQMLLTDMAAMKAVHHRIDGLKTIAKRVALAKLGTSLDTVVFDLSSADLVKTLEAKHILPDETHLASTWSRLAAAGLPLICLYVSVTLHAYHYGGFGIF